MDYGNPLTNTPQYLTILVDVSARSVLPHTMTSDCTALVRLIVHQLICFMSPKLKN